MLDFIVFKNQAFYESLHYMRRTCRLAFSSAKNIYKILQIQQMKQPRRLLYLISVPGLFARHLISRSDSCLKYVCISFKMLSKFC